jgi:hypothetical protein
VDKREIFARPERFPRSETITPGLGKAVPIFGRTGSSRCGLSLIHHAVGHGNDPTHAGGKVGVSRPSARRQRGPLRLAPDVEPAEHGSAEDLDGFRSRGVGDSGHRWGLGAVRRARGLVP